MGHSFLFVFLHYFAHFLYFMYHIDYGRLWTDMPNLENFVQLYRQLYLDLSFVQRDNLNSIFLKQVTDIQAKLAKDWLHILNMPLEKNNMVISRTAQRIDIIYTLY